jgi:hypothetical protein
MPKPGRPFLTLDVSYFDDATVVELSDGAQLLDLRGMALAKRLQSDGSLSRRQLGRLAPESGGETVDELVSVGLWIDRGDRLERRSWLEWNDSAETIAAMSKGGKRGNHLRHHVRGKNPKPNAKCEWCVEEGLVAPSPPPDVAPDRPPIAPRLAYIDVDPDSDRDVYAPPLAAITPTQVLEQPRAVAARLEQQVATVGEARAELEAAGCDERAIATVLSLIPNLKAEPVG